MSSSGTYTVVSTDGCSAIEKTIYVEAPEAPIIESVQSDGNNIVVFTSNYGDFLYSLDGINFQTSPIFYNADGGNYNIFVKSSDCDNTVYTTHLHFYIPKFFTPNNDTYNDILFLDTSKFLTSTKVYIFDRYGKLLYSAVNSNLNWDGTFIGNKLPSSDYWYLIIIGGQEFKGHFTLKH